MRWSLCLSAAIMVVIPTFSTPIPRMLLRKRGLFTTTLELTKTTPDVLAAMVTNALTSDPRPCAHVKSFFEQLAEGEADGGITTIGDRAVAGARKMLNLQSAGNAGLVQMVNELQDGTLSNQSTTALIQALSNSARTIASLKTYKFLLDTQGALTNLTTGINSLNGTGLSPLTTLVQQIQPVLVKLEDTIDNFGAAFSTQDVANQASDIQNILSLVEDSNGNVQKLKGLNKENQQAVNQLIDAAQDPMNQLAAAASEASASANSPPVIPPEQFNGKRGTACLAKGLAVQSASASGTASVGASASASASTDSDSDSSASSASASVVTASSVISSVAESTSTTTADDSAVTSSASDISSAASSTAKGSRSFYRRPKVHRFGSRPGGHDGR